jgi:hypothetical protein
VVGDIVGFCTLVKSPSNKFVDNVAKFSGFLRVLERNPEGDVLVLAKDGSELGMFKKTDLLSYFGCSFLNNVVCPPELGFLEATSFAVTRLQRKGGYNDLVRDMVIAYSLMKGSFDDDFLFHVEREQKKEDEYAAARRNG